MIVLVAYFSVSRENLPRVLELSRKMEEHSRKEPGCHIYIAQQEMDDPLQFCFYEMYEDEAAIEAHRASEHYKKFVIDGLMQLIENATRKRYEPISPALATRQF